MIIATHDGTFHADETIACAILTYIYENSQIIRSRSEEELEQADLIFDVSGKNDERHFDHHSPSFTACRPNGIRFATAGLMWHKFGREFLRKLAHDHALHADEEVVERTFWRIDREIMHMVDLQDNGQLDDYADSVAAGTTAGEQAVVERLKAFYQCDPSIPYIVATQNVHSGAHPEEQERAFHHTVTMLRQIMIGACATALSTENGISRVLACYTGGPLLIMDEHLPWTQAVIDNPEIFSACLLAVYPDRRRGWRIQSLPLSGAERFKNRLTAPQAWRGLDDHELDAQTGLKHTIFVHRSGFTGGAMEFEVTMEMARRWLAQGEYAADYAALRPEQAGMGTT